MGIYNEKRRLENNLALLENSFICETNKNIINEFKSYLIATRIGILRTNRYVLDLRLVCERHKDTPFPDWTSKDVIEVLEKVEMTDIAASSKNEYQKTLKKFFRWLKGDDWEGLKYIKGTRKIYKKPEIVTKEEILKLIEAANHPRDKAMVALLYEGGFRIGELASIKFKDIEFNKFGGKVRVRGKTGERLVPFVFSESYLKNWMQMHPTRNENSHIFISLGPASYGKPLLYERFNLILKNVVKNAGIDKKISPHTLRHSRATHLASKLTESEMCHYLGWQMGSDMPRVYVHLSGRDIDKAIYNKVYGLETNELNEVDHLHPVICPRCKENCGPTSEFCYRCGMPLKEEKVYELESNTKKLREEFIDISTENVEMLKDLKTALKFIELIKLNPEMTSLVNERVKKK
ncbi:MAG: putative tyrosine recombinase XerC-like protein [Candidatus Methanofastidiosum methylothiophilum]|uniref:Putative tyrosine recombinase XerC-like protein n=1 Tax=Candidatus Methanofastidiosum methylothiophilum TaxID=1705564 RepID=A0A150IP29_9EURY|nr:MAG: putative tyrosine recombinase XerC-like protein [Candidatus Methanofastidiosum methylthiophilus]KYC46707.1 MAG: putative tyrosine recombinase XerC-like protein [Candidatus Methanofastidiosum methylthiophilus]KYC49811.1 MAG: putative tyrosine recombinase XerC-like protein [Candidatus Methanofastidiosum methylthiophilus]